MTWEIEADANAVSRYYAALPLPVRLTARRLDALARKALPRARAGIKWSVPFYAMRGPICYVSASAKRATLGLLNGVDVADPSGLLQGTGKSPIRKAVFTAGDDVPAALIVGWLREARRLDATWGQDVGAPR